MQFLTPNLPSADLVCKDAPRGLLPSEASNAMVAERIIGIDEAGEDCRQRLDRIRMRVEIFNEIVAEMNERNNPKKD